MKLVIQAHALKKEPLPHALTGQFDERGGTIGRSATSTLTLPDPDRHVSRRQAEVIFAGAAFSIRNIGSANPIEINGRSLRPGEDAPLVAGDQLVIGRYALKVVAEPFVELMGGAGSMSQLDPLTDLLASVAPSPVPAPPSQPGSAPASSTHRANPELVGGTKAGDKATPERRQEDLDPIASAAVVSSYTTAADLGALLSSPAPAAEARLSAGSALDSTLGDLPGFGKSEEPPRSPPSGFDAAFGLGGSGSVKSSASLLDEFLAPQRPGGASTPEDALDLFSGPTAAAAAPTEPAAFNRAPELSADFMPPAVNPPIAWKPTWATPQSQPMPFDPLAQGAATTVGGVSPPVTPAEPSKRRQDESPRASSNLKADGGPNSAEELWQAFCQGAGVNVPLPHGLNPEMMRLMGQLMHTAVEGTLRLMSMRAAAKQEFRTQAPSIQSRNNNPLRFSVDPQAALTQLLQPPMRGFMPGPDAVREAMDDLLGHNTGTVAGTRAALQGMLKRFEPARLEAKLSNKGVIDAVLPMNRRAKLWELYVEHFQQVQSDATEDFHELFGKAFVKAYQHQLDLLAASRDKNR